MQLRAYGLHMHFSLVSAKEKGWTCLRQFIRKLPPYPLNNGLVGG